jgi:hypothetical protein
VVEKHQFLLHHMLKRNQWRDQPLTLKMVNSMVVCHQMRVNSARKWHLQRNLRHQSQLKEKKCHQKQHNPKQKNPNLIKVVETLILDAFFDLYELGFERYRYRVSNDETSSRQSITGAAKASVAAVAAHLCRQSSRVTVCRVAAAKRRHVCIIRRVIYQRPVCGGVNSECIDRGPAAHFAGVLSLSIAAMSMSLYRGTPLPARLLTVCSSKTRR